MKQILEAAVQFNARRGEWPTVYTKEYVLDGALQDMAWSTIDYALRAGQRGLPGVSSLSAVLKPLKAATQEGRLKEFVRECFGNQNGESEGANAGAPIPHKPPKFNL